MTELDLELPTQAKNIVEWKNIKEHTLTKIEKSFLETALKQHHGKIGLVVSNLEEYTFPYQDMLEEFKKTEWLELNEVVSLKNKTMYIFDVIEYE